jgi:hypothetical protein
MNKNLTIRKKGRRIPVLRFNSACEDKQSCCKLEVRGVPPLEASYWLCYPRWMLNLLLEREHLMQMAFSERHKEFYGVSERGMRLLDLYDRGFRFFLLYTTWREFGKMQIPCPQRIKFIHNNYYQEVKYPVCLQFADIEEPEENGHERLWIIHESRIHGLFEHDEKMQEILELLAQQQQQTAAKYKRLRYAGTRG